MAFIHKYELTLGLPETQLKQIQQSPVIKFGRFQNTEFSASPTTSYTDFNTVQKSGIVINNLHIECDISLSRLGSGSKSNPATINIFNANDSDIKGIRPDSIVLLKAGYMDEPDIPLIYAGQVKKVNTSKQGKDVVTNILCGEAVTVRKNIRYTQSFPRGTQYRDIISSLVNAFAISGVPKGSVLDAGSLSPLSIAIKSGTTYGGYLEDILKQVCEAIDYRYYVALGRLYVEPKAGVSRVEAVEILEENVKGEIQSTDNGVIVHSTSNQLTKGCSFITTLNGQITLDKYIRIKFGEFKGDYKISNIKHSLSFEGSTWDTFVECTELGGS